jgi:hypothetical protein
LLTGEGKTLPAPLWQFWTDWVIKALSTAATLLAVFVALFGSWLRNVLWPPQLRISLASRDGMQSTLFFQNKETNEVRQIPGFWWHVRLLNETRWNAVSDVYVFLLSIETPDAARNFKPIWVGQAPVTWQNNPNPQPKKIGHTEQADLCHILKEPLSLNLSPIIFGQVPSFYDKVTSLRLTLKARGVEADSNELRLKIDWDGQWSDYQAAMSRHLVVTVL